MNPRRQVESDPGVPGISGGAQRQIPVRDYDLGSTLSCGQAFRWDYDPQTETWTGVVGSRWVRLRQTGGAIAAETGTSVADWTWLEHYLQTSVVLADVLRTFPEDEPMRAAVRACAGLRLLRQEPWECLASFILSSTKQIVQIRQIVARLCERYGERVSVPPGAACAFAFPGAARVAELTESELRECKMGFRARYLRETARAVTGQGTTLAEGETVRVDLCALDALTTASARAELTRLPGVGRKIADCVLLFAYGRPEAFPIDVWMMRALGQLYFPRRRPSLDRLQRFAASHFGPHAGYAQQYLFHYIRNPNNQ